MSERGDGGIEVIKVQAGLPESLRSAQKIDNPKKKEPDSLQGWREVEFDGVRGKVTSELVEVEVDGVRSRLRALVADFREAESQEQNITLNFCGFPGLNEELRGELLRGEFDRPIVRASLDVDGFARAAKARGILIIPELQVLPVDRRKRKQTFRTDGAIIARGIEMVAKKRNMGTKPLAESNQIDLIGISNGVGEAGALAAKLSQESKDSRILLRMYSLVGLVPVADMVSAFGKEIWTIAMLEVAARYKAVFGVEYDAIMVAGQKQLLTALLGVFRSSEGRRKFVGEVRKSLKGGQEGGNLQIGLDLINKVTKDVVGLLPHMQKFDNPDYLPGIGRNVEVELIVPKHDGIFRDGLYKAFLELVEQGGGGVEVVEMLTGAFGGDIPPVVPGRWWRELLPNAGKLKMAVLGGDLTDPLSRHTGPMVAADKFIAAVGERIDF